MKGVVAPLVAAAALALAGAGFWIAGRTARDLAGVHNALATLQYGAVTTGGEGVERQLGMARRVPQVGSAALADLRDVRATADYWRGGYTAFAPQRDADGELTGADPEILLLSANAAFRASQSDADRASALRTLDAAVKRYAEVLRDGPGDADAAYNYEYAIRVRENLARARPAAPSKGAKLPAAPAGATSGDLPPGPTLHGHPGGPPAATDMAQFKIVIPKRGEERRENPEAGKGGVKVRKG